jgi:two-component system, response regulator
MLKQTILLVEDNADDVELTLRVLKHHHIANEVVVARDGEEALAFLFGEDSVFARQLPSVVVLDLNMPKVNGLEVLRRIRAEPRTRQLPVVIMTTSSEERDIVASYALGANSYVRKPVEFEEFADAVRNLGLYWLILNVPPKA